MSSAFLRKAGQFAADPVLRRWLRARLLRRTPGAPAFTPHRPPVLGEGWSGLAPESPRAAFAPLPPGPPARPIRLRLPGAVLDLAPGEEAGLFDRPLPDLEARLGLFRFAWVPLMAADDDPRWVAALWTAWRARHGVPDLESWAWHPYTAAERAINLLTFAARHGLPEPVGDSLALLAAHGPAIAARLEYFGPHHTSNHLFNNGRGLALLGLALGLPACADLGFALVLSEAERIFRPCGLLREGSSHYHLLLTRSLASLWLEARRHGRPEAVPLEARLRAAAAQLPVLALPGGLPLIGDISPDCPPSHLAGLLPGGDRASGWLALLDDADRAALTALLDGVAAGPDPAADGWLRADFGAWAGLWHAEPEGWSMMPGHGHQDCGGFELHHDGEKLLIDRGRGSYAVAGEADPDVAAIAHNGLTVDRAEPYPPNRPYYAPAFRRAVAGPAVLARAEDGVALAHHGFARLPGVGIAERHWRFTPERLELRDRLDGHSRHEITRRLHTPCAVERAERGVILTTPRGRRFHLAAGDAPVLVVAEQSWQAYGEPAPATRLEVTLFARLPWTGLLTIEVL